MPGIILGLDINDDSISAVRIKSGLRKYQIKDCCRIMLEENEALDDALKRLAGRMDLKNDLCLATVPGNQISYRNLQMPFKGRKKIRQTLPFEIETLVPFPVEDRLVDFIANENPDHNEVLAVSAEKTFISDYLEILRAGGVDPDVLDIRCSQIVTWILKGEETPDQGIFLEMGENYCTMILYQERRIALIRMFALKNPIYRPVTTGTGSTGGNASGDEQIGSYYGSLCRKVENTIHAFRCEGSGLFQPEVIFYSGIGAQWPDADAFLSSFFGIKAQLIDLCNDKRIEADEGVDQNWDPFVMNGALALATRDLRQDPGFNLRRDEFETKKYFSGLKKEIRKAAIFLLIILAFLVVDIFTEYYFLKKRYRLLDQRIKEVFSRTFPDLKRIQDPLRQMKVKINEISGSTASGPGIKGDIKALELLKDISERIPESLDVQVTRMIIDTSAVRISGKTDTFNTVDNIKTRLEASDYYSTVTISSANLDRSGKQVQFEINMKRKHWNAQT